MTQGYWTSQLIKLSEQQAQEDAERERLFGFQSPKQTMRTAGLGLALAALGAGGLGIRNARRAGAQAVDDLNAARQASQRARQTKLLPAPGNLASEQPRSFPGDDLAGLKSRLDRAASEMTSPAAGAATGATL